MLVKGIRSSDKKEALKACKKIIEEEDKEKLSDLFWALRNHPEEEVRVCAASAIGILEEGGKSVSFLKEAIDRDTSVVAYASLVAILNIKDTENPDSKKAIEIAKKKHKEDPYIQDIVKRIEKLLE